MSGPDFPDAPPPEVPEEFAATYRAAYQRALESDKDAEGSPAPAVRPQPAGDRDHAPAPEPPPRPRWLVPALLAAGAVALVVAAYVVGAALSDDESVPESTRTGQSADAEPTRGPAAGASPTERPGEGMEPVAVDAVAADCTAPPSRDSAGRRVDYAPANAIDGQDDTAWRCPGAAVGQQLTLRFGGDVDIDAVGLVPGYAKTDPVSGVDRYAENNRVTRVRWVLGDGEGVVQRLDPDPGSREVQVLQVPRTTTDSITLEILAVERGPRNTTAISEIVALAE